MVMGLLSDKGSVTNFLSLLDNSGFDSLTGAAVVAVDILNFFGFVDVGQIKLYVLPEHIRNTR